MMKIAVYYYSKFGSTKKLADAVAKAVGVQAKSVDEPLTQPVDLMFVGGAPYIASQLNKHLRDFLHQLTADQVKLIAVFSTSNWKMSIEPQVKHALRDQHIQVIDRGYMGRGAFVDKFNTNHPTPEECAAVAAYAKRTVHNLEVISDQRQN